MKFTTISAAVAVLRLLPLYDNKQLIVKQISSKHIKYTTADNSVSAELCIAYNTSTDGVFIEAESFAFIYINYNDRELCSYTSCDKTLFSEVDNDSLSLLYNATYQQQKNHIILLDKIRSFIYPVFTND